MAALDTVTDYANYAIRLWEVVLTTAVVTMAVPVTLLLVDNCVLCRHGLLMRQGLR